MKKLQFKTNIKCAGCIATVTPHLQAVSGIANWEVATDNPDKILTVVANTANAQDVKAAVQKGGFTIEEI